MYTLGIESTCDEMAVAVVKNGVEILSNCIYSQTELHNRYGGVYPELAAREHVDQLLPQITKALLAAEISKEEIDLIAVAFAPGLVGSLLIGLNAAKSLALALNKPFIGVNHVEAHLYAAMMAHKSFLFPSIGLVISGGHTFLAHMRDFDDYTLIGSTRDDAIGEAFDKVAALLNLPYPGGPAIEKLALHGDPEKYPLKAGQVKGHPLDFSFSGLKTNVLYTLKGQGATKKDPSLLSDQERADLAASFQKVALSDLVTKTKKAMEQYPCTALYIGGGVSNNKWLQTQFLKGKGDCPIYFPPTELTLDNGAMIAGLGTALFKKRGGSPLSLSPKPKTIFSSVSDKRT